MEVKIKHEQYGEITYCESFWTGKRKILVGGKEALRLSKNQFRFANGTENITVNITGNFFTGVNMVVGGKAFSVEPKIKWYEYLLALPILILNLVLSNSPAIAEVFPIIGSAIGGGISGAFMVVCVMLMKRQKNVFLKVLIGIGMNVAALLTCYLVALMLLGALA